jgi:isoquinoline 1-oxidoreductase beta subunit
MKNDVTERGPSLDRRRFLGGGAATTAGLLFGFSLPLTPRVAEAAATPTAITAWISISTDETVTILIGAQEMGQGILTGLAQIAAEELVVSWGKVRAHHAPAAAVYANPFMGGQMTGGSTSMRGFFKAMQVAGAQVREMLKQAGAAALGVPISAVTVKNGAVWAGSNSRTYGQLAVAASVLSPPASPPILGSGRYVGKSMPRVDLPAKVDGSAVFGIDVRVPGMLHAVIKQCPTLGGTLPAGYTPATPSGAVAAFAVGNAVAVVANDTWSAKKAADRMQVPWVLPKTAAEMDSVAIDTLAKSMMTSAPPAVAEKVGDAEAAIAGAPRKLDATYSLPFLAHACMEPLNCTVSVTAKKCTIWAPTQAPGLVQATAAAITGLDPSRITVNTMFMGGGLGRKFEQDYIVQAVTLAKALGKPVKLTWPREEDFTHDQYRPMALVRVRAGLDNAGNVLGWANRIVSPSILYQRWPTALVGGVDGQGVDGAIGLSYGFKSRLVEYIRHTTPLPVGFWRSVGHSINAFVVESAIDELALLAGIDPLVYRRRLLGKDTRSLAVLNAAADLAGWTIPAPAGRARGIALSAGFGSIVAQVAEISAPSATEIKVHKVAVAIDCGIAVNPDSVRAQMQGAVAHGLSAALWGQMTFVKGKAQQRNFDRYKVVRMREMPQVDVVIVSTGGPLGGVGEPGVPGVAPAVANAYAKLTGTRIRSLPFFPGMNGGGDS